MPGRDPNRLLLARKELVKFIYSSRSSFLSFFILTAVKITARRLLPSQGFTEEKLRLRKGKWLTGCHMSSLVPEPSLTHDPEIHILIAFNPVVWLTQISSNCVHLLAKLALQICIEVYTYPSSANQEFPFPYSLISQSGVPFPILPSSANQEFLSPYSLHQPIRSSLPCTALSYYHIYLFTCEYGTLCHMCSGQGTSFRDRSLIQHMGSRHGGRWSGV